MTALVPLDKTSPASNRARRGNAQHGDAPRGNAWRYCLVLAVKDLRHDWRTTLVLVVAVASILAPLLLLFGLKTGVIQSLRQDLLNDPRNLEIIIYGNFRLEPTFFTALRERDDIAFVVPKTRTINATLDLVNAKRQVLTGVDLTPTAPGDPLLPSTLPIPESPAQVLITDTVAARLGVQAGDSVLGVVRRRLDGRPETAEIGLEILGIIPAATYPGNAVFATVELLVASEDYRDGYRVPLLNARTGSSPPPPRQEFANARIYANDLDAVTAIADWIQANGIEVRTQAARIAEVRAIDRVLSTVFLIIAAVGSLGCALALGGALWANVDRKRRELALLRLFGFSNGDVMVLPVVQALVMAALAFGLAYAAYSAGAAVFNHLLGVHLTEYGYVCRLFFNDILAAAAATALVALLAAATGGHRAYSIDPAESLREI